MIACEGINMSECVMDGGSLRGILNFHTKKCSCIMFNMDQYPCDHARLHVENIILLFTICVCIITLQTFTCETDDILQHLGFKHVNSI